MRTFKYLIYSLIFVLSGIQISLSFFPAVLAGKCFFLTYLSWPLFILCVILWILNRHQLGWRYAFAVMTLCHMLWVWNYVPLQTGKLLGHSDKEYIVVSWNVSNFGHGFQNYKVLPHAAEALKNNQPDIICIQERPHTNVLSWDSIHAQFSEYPYIVKNTREDEVLNLAVFSKYPLTEVQEYYFEGTYNKVMSVDVHLDSQVVRLFNVHLQTTGLSDVKTKSKERLFSSLMDNTISRNQQADTLFQAVQHSPYPVLLCGDFNDIRSSYAYRQFYKLRDFHHVAGNGWGGTYQTIIKIDYMLCGQELQPLMYRLEKNEWSDHAMQVGQFMMKNKK